MVKTVQNILSQAPYKDELEDLNSKAIDFNNSVKEINKAKDGDEKDKKIREAKSAHAAYQCQSGIVHDLAKQLANRKDLDQNVARQVSQEYNKAAYAADTSVQKTIENQNLILQEGIRADYYEMDNDIFYQNQKAVEMKIEEMTIQSVIDAIRCGLISKSQDSQITISSIEISLEGIVSIDNVDYDKLMVKGIVKGEKEKYELWFDRKRGKFTVQQQEPVSDDSIKN